MKWKLWLDDQYDDEDMPFRHPPNGFVPARSSQEAIALTQQNGLPELISFDHDLGNGDDAMAYINWISQKENYYEEPVPLYYVHSANPVGRENIISKMESWRRSQILYFKF